MHPVVLHDAEQPPTQLSDWGVVFANGTSFELNERVVPYGLNTPLFTDYALKLRTVWLPEGTTARYTEDREFDFPVGTIFSKTFHYEKTDDWSANDYKVVKADREAMLDDRGQIDLDDYVLIETRLLVRYDDGWKALPYVWNAAQNEAYLEIAGDIRNIELVGNSASEKFTYVVPDANQCAGCHAPKHSSKVLRPLGPQAWQLNRPYHIDGAVGNQIENWSALGLLTGASTSPPTGVAWRQPGAATLEQRSRAYLASNCGHCHNPDGSADTSALDLNLGAALDRGYGICKPPVAVGRGSGDRPYDIFPGKPDASIMLYRMQQTDPAIAMPELGRSTVHAEGVALIHDWIAAMPGSC
jgi:uncharacterized repeat protein (TIGR03806 family)